MAASAQSALSTLQLPQTAQKPFHEGIELERRGQWSSAVDSYRAAAKASGSHCLPCLEAIARVQMLMELYKDSAATAAQMAAQSPDPVDRAQAETLQATALYESYFAQNDGRGAVSKDTKRALESLKQADSVLLHAEADDPSSEPVRMLRGRVLAAEKQDEQAQKEFSACATAGSTPQECARAAAFARDPDLARNEPAPNFSLRTMDGKTVTLQSLAGKVVLIDFWATWCKYCEQDSDYIQSLYDDFDSDRFVLLEVSVDENEVAWQHYVDDRRLHGVQTRDSNKQLSGLFHVAAYPTYLVINAQGVVQLRAVGVQGDLRGTVRKLVAALPAPASASATVPPVAPFAEPR